MDFIQQLGPAALGSRLRRLSEQLTNAAAAVYAQYELDFQPRWFPVFYLVGHQPNLSSNEIAERIGHTHAAVSQVATELARQGLLSMLPDPADQRRRRLALTPAGQLLLPQLRRQTEDVRRSMEDLLTAVAPDFWVALGTLEEQLRQQPLPQRVAAARQQRERQPVQLRDFVSADQPVFRQLNEEWITHYFQLEPADLKALDHPEEYILQPGGCILLAEYAGRAVGTCALISMGNHSFELAKMAVTPAAQGQGIGLLLGQAAIQRAREMGGQRVYLESNSKLITAVNLYQKLGFKMLPQAVPSPYARADVQMELQLK